MKIAIIGKPFSGKTELLKSFKKFGFNILSVDQIIHESYKKGNIGYQIILENFGQFFVNENEVIRSKLIELIIKDKEAFEKLNELTKKIVEEKLSKVVDYIIEIPHLAFTKVNIKFDLIIKVDTSQEILLQRLAADQTKAKEFIDRIWKKWDEVNFKFDEILDGSLNPEENALKIINKYNLNNEQNKFEI